MDNFKKVTLGEIANFRNGVNYDNSSFGEGIKVINVSDFKNRMIPDYHLLGELDIESKWAEESFLIEEDIVFVRSNGNKNLIGRSIFIKNLPVNTRVTYSAFCIRLRFKSNIELVPLFYLYVFKSEYFRSILSSFGNGTNINNLNQQILANLSVPFPPLPTQKKIASILSAYDDLIENNRQRIQLLEAMAEEIYKEWFVRFRFPGYQDATFVDAQGNAVPFGTEGALPEGWEKGELGELVDIKKGKNITRSIIQPGIVPVVAGGLLPAYYHNVSNTKSPTITVSASGANAGYVNLYYEDIWASDCSYIDENTTETVYFYFSLLKAKQTEIFFLQKGSAQPHVYPKDLMSLELIKPSSEMILKFENFIASFFEQIKTLQQKNQLLQQTRDLLLPRLMSGKLEV